MSDYNNIVRKIKETGGKDSLDWFALADLLEERGDDRHEVARHLGWCLTSKKTDSDRDRDYWYDYRDFVDALGNAVSRRTNFLTELQSARRSYRTRSYDWTKGHPEEIVTLICSM